MKIYIAGPMRGHPGQNFDSFFIAAMQLRELGHTVVNPAEKDMANGINPWEPCSEAVLVGAFRWDFEQLMDCDAIFLLGGWGGSQGACSEIMVATCMGLKILQSYQRNDTFVLQENEVESFALRLRPLRECDQ